MHAQIYTLHYTGFQTIKTAKNHLKRVKTERVYYREACEKSAKTLEDLFPSGIPKPGANIPPKSNKGCIHYSFDMAQQVQNLYI